MTKQINHFRARVEIAVSEKDSTLAELARGLNKSQTALNRILDRGNPKTSVLREIAEVLEIDPAELLEEVTLAEYGEISIPRLAE